MNIKLSRIEIEHIQQALRYARRTHENWLAMQSISHAEYQTIVEQCQQWQQVENELNSHCQ